MIYLKSIRTLFTLLVIVLNTSAQSNNNHNSPPTVQKIISILFDNQHQTFNLKSFESGLNCKPKTVGCLIQGILVGLAQDSYSKGDKKSGKTWTPHGWSNTSCKMVQSASYIKYVTNNNLYKPAFLSTLQKLKNQEFWECTISWGVARGNIFWSQELRFSLSKDKKSLIPNSFAAMNTP